MRVVLDTNTFLSALISPAGPPAVLVRAWLDDRYTLVSHPRQLEELRLASRRTKISSRFKRSAAGTLINQITQIAESPRRLKHVSRSPDPFDDYLLAICEAGHAARLVTGDKADLLALGKHGPTTILTAAAFAAELNLYPSPAR